MARLKLTLHTGETIVGVPNYTNETHVEIRVSSSDYRWIERSEIARFSRLKGDTSDR